MKALAYVEIDPETQIITGPAIKIYSKKSFEEIENFMNTAKRLIEFERNQGLRIQEERANINAELRRLDSIGRGYVCKNGGVFQPEITGSYRADETKYLDGKAKNKTENIFYKSNRFFNA